MSGVCGAHDATEEEERDSPALNVVEAGGKKGDTGRQSRKHLGRGWIRVGDGSLRMPCGWDLFQSSSSAHFCPVHKTCRYFMLPLCGGG